MVVREVCKVLAIWSRESRAVDAAAEASVLRTEMSAFAMTRSGVARPDSLRAVMGAASLMLE